MLSSATNYTQVDESQSWFSNTRESRWDTKSLNMAKHVSPTNVAASPEFPLTGIRSTAKFGITFPS